MLAAEALFPYNRYTEIPLEGIFDVFLLIQEKYSQAKRLDFTKNIIYVYTTSTSSTLKNDANINAVVHSLPLMSKKEFCCFNTTPDVPTQ